MFSVPCIRADRIHSNGELVAPSKASGVKWALLSALSTIAATAVTIGSIAALVLASLALASGIGMSAAIVQLVAAVLAVFVASQLIHVAVECIKTAQHHFHSNNKIEIKTNMK